MRSSPSEPPALDGGSTGRSAARIASPSHSRTARRSTFSSSTTLTLALLRSGHAVTFVPVATRRRIGRSKIRLIEDGARFFVIILKIATLFSPLRVFMPVSALFLFAGLANYAYTYTKWGRFTNMSALMFSNCVLVFLLSLVAEQIALMRMERSEGTSREPHRDE